MTLFEECVEALSDDFSLLSEEKEKEVLNIFINIHLSMEI